MTKITLRCCVKLCQSNSKSKDSNLFFFKFPQDPDLRMKWIFSVKGKNWNPPKYAVVCSLHFEPDQIKNDLVIRDKDGTIIQKRRVYPRLMKGSIPSIFPSLPPSILDCSPGSENKQSCETTDVKIEDVEEQCIETVPMTEAINVEDVVKMENDEEDIDEKSNASININTTSTESDKLESIGHCRKSINEDDIEIISDEEDIEEKTNPTLTKHEVAILNQIEKEESRPNVPTTENLWSNELLKEMHEKNALLEVRNSGLRKRLSTVKKKWNPPQGEWSQDELRDELLKSMHEENTLLENWNSLLRGRLYTLKRRKGSTTEPVRQNREEHEETNELKIENDFLKLKLKELQEKIESLGNSNSLLRKRLTAMKKKISKKYGRKRGKKQVDKEKKTDVSMKTEMPIKTEIKRN